MTSKWKDVAWMAVIIFATFTAAYTAVDYYETSGPALAWIGGFLTGSWIVLTIGEWDENDDE